MVPKHIGQSRLTLRGSLWFLLGVLAVTACGGPRTMLLTDKRYAPRPASQPIDLFQGDVRTAHEEIAIVDTIAVEQLTSDTQKAMVENLRTRARDVGADAVKNVTMLMRADRGWVPDPQTPFRSWRQGWTDFYFLRGRAIRFKPLLVERGEGTTVGDPFEWSEDERPAPRPESKEELEIYEVKDRFGRRGFASRPVRQKKPKLPTVEAGD